MYTNRVDTNKRIESMDICRALCMLSVIAGHICQRYGTPHIMQFFYSFHMPLMFVISGYFISDKGNIRSFINSKAKRILIPYGIACCLIIIGQVLLSAIKHRNVLRTMIKWVYASLYGSGSSAGSYYIDLQGNIQQTDGIGMLWFLLALFWGSLILRLIIHLKPMHSFLIAVSCFLVGVLSVKLFWLPFSIQNGLVAVLYMWGGYYVKLKSPYYGLLRRSNKILLTILLVIIWSVSVIFGQTLLYNNYFKLGIVDVVGSFAGVAIIYYLSVLISKSKFPLKGKLIWFGMNSMPVYVIHACESFLCQPNWIINKFEISMPTQMLLSFLVILIGCIVGTLLMGKIKLFRNIFKIAMRSAE